jgi:hypothetical protein
MHSCNHNCESISIGNCRGVLAGENRGACLAYEIEHCRSITCISSAKIISIHQLNRSKSKRTMDSMLLVSQRQIQRSMTSNMLACNPVDRLLVKSIERSMPTLRGNIDLVVRPQCCNKLQRYWYRNHWYSSATE